MHSNEIPVDRPLVAALLRTQFPRWADLSLRALPHWGTDNVAYRLGRSMVIRLPRTQQSATRLQKEHIWLPKLAPLLPLSIPVPIAKGMPSSNYPVNWSIYPWIKGESARTGFIANSEEEASRLANFITILHQIDTAGGPQPGVHNFFRGVPLIKRDHETRMAIRALAGDLDTATVTDAWDLAVQAPQWRGLPVWIHGDLLPDNLLVDDGKLSAIIDFGGLAVGDPACDLITAWSLFSRGTREIFRHRLAVDNATWLRGRGWALSIGLIGLSYYRSTNPAFAALTARMISEVIDDYKR